MSKGTSGCSGRAAHARGGQATTPAPAEQAARFIEEQSVLLHAELASKEAVAARINELPVKVRAEVVRQLQERTGKRTGKRAPKNSGYVREEQRNRTTGTKVALYDCRHPDSVISEADGGRWAAVCEDHGLVVQDERYETARWCLAHPEEFCEVCSAWLQAKKEKAAGDERPGWEIVREILTPQNGYAPTGPADDDLC